jgi:3-oxoacyl-[acyl-carrier protein] reductase
MRRLSGQLPLQRISTPEDIAESIMFLLTARSMTGQIVRAENGQTL